MPTAKTPGTLKTMGARQPKQLLLTQQLPLGSKTRARLRENLSPRSTHGGRESFKKRKTPRPFAPNRPMHIVLKSKRARGRWSLLHRRNKGRILVAIHHYAERYKVHLYQSAVVHDHIHLCLKARERKHLADFLRVLAGRTAVHITGAVKGVKKVGKFWDYLCWSRIVNWGKDFYHVRRYVLANRLEEMSKSHREWIRKSTLIEQWEQEPPDLATALG